MSTLRLISYAGHKQEGLNMRKFTVSAAALSLCFLMVSLTIRPSYALSAYSTVTSSGTISYSTSSPFVSRGTNVDLNTLTPGLRKYQPNGWAILQDLGVNVIDIRGGGEGDYYIRWNINNYPNEWAANFNNFLSQADSHGIKVTFSLLGTDWDTMFGIQCPEPYRGIAGTTVLQAKSMVDKLAGNNSLNHNFLTDPRVMAWSPANEVDIGNSVTRNWVLQILDYMKSKGATVYVSCPINTSFSSTWLESISFQATEPILRGHVDFLCFHIYEVHIAYQAQENGQDVYNVMYNHFKANLQQYMINGRGATPVDKLVLGEFGLWVGYYDSMGVSANFTEQTRGAYYHAIYQACADLGIKHIFNYYCFADNNPRYEIVDKGGVYFIQCTSILQQYYK